MPSVGKTMAINDFPTPTSSQGAFPEPFPTCKALPTTPPSRWEKKPEPPRKGQLSPTLPRNEWFRRVSTPRIEWPPHHEPELLPLFKTDRLCNLLDLHCTPPTRPTSKLPEPHRKECKQRQSPLLLANSGQDPSQRQHRYFLPTNLSSLAPDHPRQQYATFDANGHIPDSAAVPSDTQPPCDARVNTATAQAQPSMLSWQSSTKKEKTDQDHHSKVSSLISAIGVSTSFINSEAVHQTPTTTATQMPFFANMPDDLRTMEWLTTEMMQESSILIWTMLLPFGEELW